MVISPPYNTEPAGVSPPLLEQLGRFVESRMGLYFPPEQSRDLERGIRSAADEFGFDDAVKCIKWILTSNLSKPQIKIIAGHLTIGETYFFRDRRVFEVLETEVFPEIIASRRNPEKMIRIWSAGCATGEEPYSIAMTVERVLPDYKKWDMTILATDIVPIFIKKASEGVYREWSFRGTSFWFKQRCFTKIKGKYHIAPRFRDMITFAPLNLAEDPYPAIITNTNAMDVIFCRNVLMYFSRDKARKVVDGLANCLVDGGWLIISPVESYDVGLSSCLNPVHFPGAILYKKGNIQKKKIQKPILATYKPENKKEALGKIKTNYGRPENRFSSIPQVEKFPAHPGEQTTSRVRLLANKGKLSEALDLCKDRLKLDKLNPTLHYLQASILLELGRTNEAQICLQRSLYIDQEFAIAHFSLGNLLQTQGKIKEAGKHLRKARSLFAGFPQDSNPPESEGITAGRLIKLIDTMGINLNRR